MSVRRHRPIRHAVGYERRVYCLPMSPLDAVVRGLLKDIGACLRPSGFRGSSGLWRLSTPEGVAVVQKQGSSGSTWHEKSFFLNTAVVPTIWWQWKASSLRDPGPIERAFEWHGIRLLERRTEWCVTADTDIAQLRTDLQATASQAGARLAELLAPDRYLDELRALPDKQIGHWEALAVLLAGHGPSAELDQAIAGLAAALADRPSASEFAPRLAAWARARVSA
jgi:hypothetical protein